MTIAEWSQLCGVVTVLEAAEKEIGRLNECLAMADADRIPLAMDCEALREELESARAAWNIWQAETERLREERREATRQLAAMTAARDEACELADSALTNLCDATKISDDGMRSNIFHADKRIAELRKVGR